MSEITDLLRTTPLWPLAERVCEWLAPKLQRAPPGFWPWVDRLNGWMLWLLVASVVVYALTLIALLWMERG